MHTTPQKTPSTSLEAAKVAIASMLPNPIAAEETPDHEATPDSLVFRRGAFKNAPNVYENPAVADLPESDIENAVHEYMVTLVTLALDIDDSEKFPRILEFADKIGMTRSQYAKVLIEVLDANEEHFEGSDFKYIWDIVEDKAEALRLLKEWTKTDKRLLEAISFIKEWTYRSEIAAFIEFCLATLGWDLEKLEAVMRQTYMWSMHEIANDDDEHDDGTQYSSWETEIARYKAENPVAKTTETTAREASEVLEK